MNTLEALLISNNIEDVKIIKNDFSDFDSVDEDVLSEDMLQINSQVNNDNYTFDVGWYETPPNLSYFKIYIIKNCDWEDPVYEKVISKNNELAASLKEALSNFKILISQ